MKLIYVLPFALLLAFIMFVPLIFMRSMDFFEDSVGSSGWSAIRPLGRDTDYPPSGIISLSFTNFEKNVTLGKVSVRDVSADEDCEITEELNGRRLKYKERFNIPAVCPPKSTGQVYTLYVTIPYTFSVDGNLTEDEESGRLMGQVGE